MSDTKNPKFMYFRFRNPEGEFIARGGLVLAYNEVTEKHIVYAASSCHMNDNFNRITGRKKAAGRLQSPNYAQSFVGSIDDLQNAVLKGQLPLNTEHKIQTKRRYGRVKVALARKFHNPKHAATVH